MMVTKEVIKEWAKELYEEHADTNGDMFADSTLQALQIMGERAAGLGDPERPQVERMEDGYKITYNGIEYQAKGGFISVMAPQVINGKSLIYDMQKVINRHSLENHSNTPDYALAAFMLQVLVAYGQAVKKRDDFHEAVMSPPFKSGGPVPNNTGCFEDVPVIVTHLTGTPDLTDPNTLKNTF